jgi:phosphoglycolate phosphatase
MKKRYTHVIWDFNGTLYNDVEACIQSANRLLRAHGLSPIASVEAYREIFGFPIDAYYRRLGFDFEKEDYDTVLAPEWVAMYLAGEASCATVEGAVETVRRVKTMGIPQILLSATKIEMLTAQLERLGILEEFDEVIGLDNIHARSKKAQALDWKQRHPDARPLFIGDTEHDAQVADAVGGDCVLFVGGHQSASRLAACGKPLIERIGEITDHL